jgi:hypothetical protein
LPFLRYSYKPSAAYGRICKIATFKNKHPANVVPKALNKGLFLKLVERNGKVPNTITMIKKQIITTILRIHEIV